MWKINFLKLNISIYYYLRASNVTIRILPDRTQEGFSKWFSQDVALSQSKFPNRLNSLIRESSL